MKNFRSLLIALCALALIACGDDTVDLGPGDPDSGVEDDASTQPPPDEEGDEDDEGRGDDPGDGDDGPGDEPGDGDDGPGDDPGDGDDGPGDDDEETASLSFTLMNSNAAPYAGATVRIVGSDISPTTSDADGVVHFEVPEDGSYLMHIAGSGATWGYAQSVTIESDEIFPSTVFIPPPQVADALEEATGEELSEQHGIVFFHFQAQEAGGQSAQLPSGEPFVQLDSGIPDVDGDLIPGSTLVPNGGEEIIYINVSPGALTPVYVSSIAGEVCQHVSEPSGGWESIAKTLLLVYVRCSRTTDP